LDTLAWANFCTAHLDEALAEERRATDEIEGGKRKEFDGFLARLEHAILEWSERGGRALRVDEAARLTALVVELERRVNERRTYEFDDPQDRWWHAQLAQLVADLKALTAENTGGLYSSGISEKHGWGIPKRVEFARTIEARSLTDPEAKQRWDQAIAAIASNPNYSGLKMTPQLGLLPIGEDPDSHLWEFAHLQTGEVAQRDADGRLVLNGKTGLVFVLVPGGAFWMGAQKTDPTKPNFDPQAQDDESPVHELTLTPYFLSKYEMTQGQWLGFVGKNPSCFGPSTTGALHHHDLRHPVERVSWEDCMQVLSRLGLTLPSEAQWEHGARGGTDTPWWTGSERESLRGKANLADQTAAKTGADWEDIKDWPDLNDDWALHAPAGTFAANPFGLHEVHGNVAEWCLDWYDWRFYASSPKVDPVAPWQGSPERVFRGGSFDRAASIARSAFRDRSPPEFRASSLGLRPAAASSLSTSPHPH
jgi:formylglycine-generating enzyme required for sulfatase activity